MTRRLLACSTAVIVLALGGIADAHAQSIFEGKTVRIIVGLAPGGGFVNALKLASEPKLTARF